MHECYAMQILEAKKNKKKIKKKIQNTKTRAMVTKSKAMNHNDHVRKTQFN